MAPRIEYAQTRDGVSIAFWRLGEGMPLVYIPNLIWSHAQLEWQIPEISPWFERLAEGRNVVRFDPRGTGLSQRTVQQYSLQALEMDLEAVVERLGLDRFALFGDLNAGPVAIAYAAHHPERVSRLILWCSWARTADTKGPRMLALEALQRLMDKDWETFTETRAHMGFGWEEGESAHRYAAFMRECITPEMAWRAYRAADEFDVSSLLAEIRSPTLVLHRRQLYFWDVEVARTLATQIPDAHFALLEGGESAPYLGDTTVVLNVIDQFLSEDEEAQGAVPGGLVTILFTDMGSSTALSQHLGDAAAHEVRRAHNAIVRAAVKAQGGSEIKHTGDGIMASFATASSALNCALAIQRGVAARVAAEPQLPLEVYVGLNAGEPIAEERDLFGTSVDLARRICDHAQAGEILVSDVVRQLASGKQFLFADRGVAALKGFDEPMRLYELRWRD